MTKLFEYDKKVWDDGDTRRTWQFGIIKNRTIFCVHQENPSGIVYASGGVNILISLLTSSCLFGIDVQTSDNSWSLGFYFFTEYFEGWDE